MQKKNPLKNVWSYIKQNNKDFTVEFDQFSADMQSNPEKLGKVHEWLTNNNESFKVPVDKFYQDMGIMQPGAEKKKTLSPESTAGLQIDSPQPKEAPPIQGLDPSGSSVTLDNSGIGDSLPDLGDPQQALNPQETTGLTLNRALLDDEIQPEQAPERKDYSEDIVKSIGDKYVKLIDDEHKNWADQRIKQLQDQISKQSFNTQKEADEYVKTLNDEFSKESLEQYNKIQGKYNQQFEKEVGQTLKAYGGIEQLKAQGDQEKAFERNKEKNPFETARKSFWNTLWYQLPATTAAAAGYTGGPMGINALDRRFMPKQTSQFEKMFLDNKKAAQKELYAWAAKRQNEGQEYSKDLVSSIDKISDPIDALNWVSYAVGQAGGQIPVGIASGGTSILGQEVGGIYLEMVKLIAEEKGITPEEVIEKGYDDSVIPLVGGIAASALERYGAGQVWDAFAKNIIKKSLRSRGLNILKSGTVEAFTEMPQTMIETISAQLASGKSIEEAIAAIDPMEVLEAGGQGFFGGGGLTTIGAAIGKTKDLTKSKIKPQSNETEQNTERQKSEPLQAPDIQDGQKGTGSAGNVPTDGNADIQQENEKKSETTVEPADNQKVGAKESKENEFVGGVFIGDIESMDDISTKGFFDKETGKLKYRKSDGDLSILIHEALHRHIKGRNLSKDDMSSKNRKAISLWKRILSLTNKEDSPTVFNVFEEYSRRKSSIMHEELVNWYLTNIKFRNQIDNTSAKSVVNELVKEVTGLTETQIQEIKNKVDGEGSTLVSDYFNIKNEPQQPPVGSQKEGGKVDDQPKPKPQNPDSKAKPKVPAKPKTKLSPKDEKKATDIAIRYVEEKTKEPEHLSWTDKAITDFGGFKISKSTFDRFFDRNKADVANQRAYIDNDPDAQGLDSIAAEISLRATDGQDSDAITPEDLVSFIERFPFGIDQALTSPEATKLRDEYKALTGKDLRVNNAEKIKEANQVSDEQFEQDDKKLEELSEEGFLNIWNPEDDHFDQEGNIMWDRVSNYRFNKKEQFEAFIPKEELEYFDNFIANVREKRENESEIEGAEQALYDGSVVQDQESDTRKDGQRSELQAQEEGQLDLEGKVSPPKKPAPKPKEKAPDRQTSAFDDTEVVRTKTAEQKAREQAEKDVEAQGGKLKVKEGAIDPEIKKNEFDTPIFNQQSDVEVEANETTRVVEKNNKSEIEQVKQLLNDPNEPSDQKQFWRDDLKDLENNPKKYWDAFAIETLDKNDDRYKQIKFMQEYYSKRGEGKKPAPKERSETFKVNHPRKGDISINLTEKEYTALVEINNVGAKSKLRRLGENGLEAKYTKPVIDKLRENELILFQADNNKFSAMSKMGREVSAVAERLVSKNKQESPAQEAQGLFKPKDSQAPNQKIVINGSLGDISKDGFFAYNSNYSKNQDAIYADGKTFIISDGMGSYDQSGLFAKELVDQIGKLSDKSITNIHNTAKQISQRYNNAAATLSLLVDEGNNQFSYYSIGDSPIYVIDKNNKVKQRINENTQRQTHGFLAFNDNRWVTDETSPITGIINLSEGDRIIISSDGFGDAFANYKGEVQELIKSMIATPEKVRDDFKSIKKDDFSFVIIAPDQNQAPKDKLQEAVSQYGWTAEQVGNSYKLINRKGKWVGNVQILPKGRYKIVDRGGATLLSGNKSVVDATTKTLEQYWLAKKNEPESSTKENQEQAPKEKPTNYGKENKVFTQDAAAKARELLRKKLGNIRTGLDPEMIQAGLTLAGYHIEAGARKFADYSKAMIDDLGEGVRPYLRSFYESVRHYPGFDNKGMSTPEEIDNQKFLDTTDPSMQEDSKRKEKISDAISATIKNITGQDLTEKESESIRESMQPSPKLSLKERLRKLEEDDDKYFEALPLGTKIANAIRGEGWDSTYILDIRNNEKHWYGELYGRKILGPRGEPIPPSVAASFYKRNIVLPEVDSPVMNINTQDNDTDTPNRVESDSAVREPADREGEQANEPQTRPDRGGPEQGSRNPDQEGVQREGDTRLPDDRSIPTGETGNLELFSGRTFDRPGGNTSSTREPGGATNNSGQGVLDGGRGPAGFDKIDPTRLSKKERLESQRKANSKKVIVNNPDNVRETLPVLFPEQQDDVIKAEARFSETPTPEDPKKGMLFTNGTGTGKTFVGLGIAKRFYNQGKRKILIVAPNDKVISVWKSDGKKIFGLDIMQLGDTPGKKKTTDRPNPDGITITSISTFVLNENIGDLDYDLVIYDESHKLLEEKTGVESKRSYRHYQISNQNRYQAEQRLRNAHPIGKKINKTIKELNTLKENTINKNDLQFIARKSEIEDKLDGLRKQMEAYMPEIREQAKQAVSNTKVVFLSATPFKFHFNLKYANGYLFDWGTATTYEQATNVMSRVDPQSRFFLDNFSANYEWKNHQLQTRQDVNPEAVWAQEQEFADRLFQSGAMSGRKIDIEYDYSREFPVVSGFNADKFNQAYNDIYDFQTKEFDQLREGARQTFGDYNYSTALYESLRASMSIDRITKHLDLGRKVIVFHRRRKSEAGPPYSRILRITEAIAREKILNKSSDREVEEGKEALLQIDKFREKYADLLQYENSLPYDNAINIIKGAFGSEMVSEVNSSSKKEAAIDAFNDDESDVKIIMVQEESGKEGVSLHDTTGKYPRALLSLSLPLATTTALQIEGRPYRIGNKSNAIFEYPLLGLDTEVEYFGQNLNRRLSTTENLALGSMARNLLRSFSEGVSLNSSTEDPSLEQGTGGKAIDRNAADKKDPFDLSILAYDKRGKMRGKRDQRLGADLYPTPEPLGFKMVEWAGLKPGDEILEPSAGLGSLAMWAPPYARLTMIEPSPELNTKLRGRVTHGNSSVIKDIFENHYIGNKYDGIVMNPPFGNASKLAWEHTLKATNHLRMGGRVLSIVPQGSSFDKKLDNWLDPENKESRNWNRNYYVSHKIKLPSVLFEKVHSGQLNTQMIVIDHAGKEWLENNNTRTREIDLSYVTSLNEFFEEIRDLGLDPRPNVKPKETAAEIADQVKKGNVDVDPLGAKDDDVELVENKHTKTGEQLYTIKMNKQFDRDQYMSAKAKAKSLGGYYSSYKGNGAIPGFIFKDKESAQKMLEFFTGDDSPTRKPSFQYHERWDGRTGAQVEQAGKKASPMYLQSIINRLRKAIPGIEVITDQKRFDEALDNILNTGTDEVKFQVIGEQAAKTNRDLNDLLSQAKRLEEKGVNAKEIYIRTGWERGADRAWEYDLNDTSAEIIVDTKALSKAIETLGDGFTMPLGNVLKYPELYKLYPDMDMMPVIFTNLLEENVSAAYVKPNRKYKRGAIKVRPLEYVGSERNRSQRRITELQSITHELQHAIQDREPSFSRGSNLDVERQQIRKELFGDKSNLSDKEVEIIDALGFSLYSKTSGEVEARNVEFRLTMPYAQRRTTPISETEDVARNSQYVKFQQNEVPLSYENLEGDVLTNRASESNRYPTASRVQKSNQEYEDWERGRLPEVYQKIVELNRKRYLAKQYLDLDEVSDILSYYQQLANHQYRGPEVTDLQLQLAIKTLHDHGYIEYNRLNQVMRSFIDRYGKFTLQGVKFQSQGNKPTGFIFRDKVYINPESARMDTPIHEYAHLWLAVLKHKYQPLYKRGLSLVKRSTYFDQVKNNPFYANLDTESKAEEALAIAIGEKGALMAGNNFKLWLRNLWDRIKTFFGIKKAMDPYTMTLNDFVKMGAKELLSGEEVVQISSLRMPESATMRLSRHKTVDDAWKQAEKRTQLDFILRQNPDAWAAANESKRKMLATSLMMGIQDKTRQVKIIQDEIFNHYYNVLIQNAKAEPDKAKSREMLKVIKKNRPALLEKFVGDDVDVHGSLDLKTGKVQYAQESIRRKFFGDEGGSGSILDFLTKKTNWKGEEKLDENSIGYKLAQEGLSLMDLGFYGHVRHAKVRNSRVEEISFMRMDDELIRNGSGMTNEEADAFMKEIEESGKKDVLEKYYQVMREELVLKPLAMKLDAGIIDQEFHDQMVDYFGDTYVPLAVAEKAFKGNRWHGNLNKGVFGKGINRIKGTGRYKWYDRINPFIQLLANYDKAMSDIEQNEVNKKLYKLVEKNPDDRYWRIESPKYLPKFNANGEIDYLDEVTPKDVKDKAVKVFIEGKMKYIVLEDARLQKAFQSTGQTDNEILRILQNSLNSLNNYLRMMYTTINIDFALPNLVRDMQDALVNLSEEQVKGIKRKVVKGILPAMKAVAAYEKGNFEGDWVEAYHEMKKSGGEISWLNYTGAEKEYRNIEAEIDKFKQPTVLGQATNVAMMPFRTAFNAIMLTNKMFEMAIRLSTYKNLRDSGVSAHKASVTAKNVTVNFNKKGEWSPWLNAAYLFVNAGIQGATRHVTALINSAAARRTLAGAMMGWLMLRIINDAMDEDDELDLLITDEDRETNLVLFNPFSPKKPIMIPISYNMRGPKSIMDYGYDVYKGKKEFGEAIVKSFGVFFDSMFPIAQQNGVPTVAQPAFELYINKRMYNDSPIFPEKYDGTIKDSESYFSNARDLSVMLAKQLGYISENRDDIFEISPNTIDYLIDWVFGGFRTMLNSAEQIKNYSNGNPLDWNKVSIARRFMADLETQDWRLNVNYYELYNKGKYNRLSRQEAEEMERLAYRLLEKEMMDRSKLKQQLRKVFEVQVTEFNNQAVFDQLFTR